jgi:quercetin dioxygenase-like cupin family protein
MVFLPAILYIIITVEIVTIQIQQTHREIKMNAPNNPSEHQNLTESPALLTDLIQYQQGSVVSRTLIDKKTGTITLFAFDTNQGLSEHTAPFDAMVSIIDGKMEITIGGKANTLSHGEIIIMPANIPHGLIALEKCKMMLVMIRS